MKIIKEELRFEENLKKRLEFICEFSKVTPTFVNGSIRKIEKTNISYIEPHRVIVKDTTFLVFNYSNDVYISNLAKKIKLSELNAELMQLDIGDTPLGVYQVCDHILLPTVNEKRSRENLEAILFYKKQMPDQKK